VDYCTFSIDVVGQFWNMWNAISYRTHCVLCETHAEAEESTKDLDITDEDDKFYINLPLDGCSTFNTY
jgi:hypothetical protein